MRVVEHLSPGNYFLVMTSDESIITKRFVKL